MYIQNLPASITHGFVLSTVESVGIPIRSKNQPSNKRPKLAKVIGLSLVSAVKSAVTTDSLCFSGIQLHLKAFCPGT